MLVRPESHCWNPYRKALGALVLYCGTDDHDHVLAYLDGDASCVCEHARQRLDDPPTELHYPGVVIQRQGLRLLPARSAQGLPSAS